MLKNTGIQPSQYLVTQFENQSPTNPDQVKPSPRGGYPVQTRETPAAPPKKKELKHFKSGFLISPAPPKQHLPTTKLTYANVVKASQPATSPEQEYWDEGMPTDTTDNPDMDKWSLYDSSIHSSETGCKGEVTQQTRNLQNKFGKRIGLGRRKAKSIDTTKIGWKTADQSEKTENKIHAVESTHTEINYHDKHVQNKIISDALDKIKESLSLIHLVKTEHHPAMLERVSKLMSLTKININDNRLKPDNNKCSKQLAADNNKRCEQLAVNNNKRYEQLAADYDTLKSGVS